MFRATADRGLCFALCSVLAACSSDAEGPSTGAPEAPNQLLAPPRDGVQVRAVGTPAPAGSDLEWCEVAEFPGTPGQTYYVNRIDLAKSQFSHHLFVSTVATGSPAEAAASELGVGQRVPCQAASSAFGEGTVTIAGAAKPLQTIPYPEGIGQKYIGGQKLILDYHYYNTSIDDVQAEVAVNFHIVPESAIKKLSHGFAAMNLTIEIPPLSKAAFTGECRFSQDLLVGAIVRHTHRWGTNYQVWTVDGANHVTPLWSSDDWQEDIDKRFDEPMLFRAGEGFRYRCEFQNTEERTIRFGTKATDEMCNLFGSWWVVNEGDAESPQQCMILSTDADGIGRATGSGFGPF
jgi:hypothetical protein